jgi:rRNA maturation protein Nop10
VTEKRKPARPWDLLNPNIENVPEEIKNKRYAICTSCELLNTVTKTCAACGCFMALKTKLPHAFCPKDKWDIYIDEKMTGVL